MRKKDLKGEVNLFDYPSHVKYLREQNKGFMPYYGVIALTGKQGSGKTLNGVRLINNIFCDFKNTLLVTNVNFNLDICTEIPKDNVIPFHRYYQLFEYDDYPGGVIFFIDEAHILFNSLNSRNTDVNLFKQISQNRKNRRCFILTTQVFERLEKFMREQISTIITNTTYLNFLTISNVWSDFDIDSPTLNGKRLFGFCFTHKKDLHYKMYNTRQKINFDKDSPFWRTKDLDHKEGIYAYTYRIPELL